jgi:O-antigen biosynthesis protein
LQKQAIALYTCKEKWSEAVKIGFDLVNELFNKERFHKILTNRIKEITEDLERHRSNNFTGAMLKYHYSRSTYFLSKYIEIKNELEKHKK